MQLSTADGDVALAILKTARAWRVRNHGEIPGLGDRPVDGIVPTQRLTRLTLTTRMPISSCVRWSRPRHTRRCRAACLAWMGRSAIRADSTSATADPPGSERAASRPSEHRGNEDLHIVCIRSASLLHVRELRCWVTRGQGPQGGNLRQGSAAICRCVPAEAHIRANVTHHFEQRPRNGPGWSRGSLPTRARPWPHEAI